MLAIAERAPQGPPDPIAALIARGDHRGAVIECVRLHGGALGRLCMALLGSQAEAEEATQETLLAAHASMASFRGEGTVRAWLFAIARRQCARRYEQRQHERRHLSLAGPTDSVAPADFAAAERARALTAALATLKPSERETLVLRFTAELSFREIAEMSGIDEAAARKRASRALARLKNLLPEDMFP